MSIKYKQTFKLQLYFIIFAISGFSGLIYESIWSHYLKLFLGHAAYAQTLVLIIFMGGMALGSWLAAKYSIKFTNLFIVYAIIEGIIGILGIIFHPVFIYCTDITFSSILPNINSIFLTNSIKWSFAAFLIFPQSVLLGATFPVMSAGIIRTYPDKPGKSLAILYFTNSLGAAFGVLVSRFVLIKSVGLPGTIVIAALINLLIAFIIVLISGNNLSIEPVNNSKPDLTVKKPVSQLFFIFLLISAFTGTASFMYEIGWIRMLSMVLGSTTHAFELMLSSFVFGLAIGGYIIRTKIDRIRNIIKLLGFIQVAMGLLAIITLLLYGETYRIMSYAINNFPVTNSGYSFFNLVSYGIASIIMLPATICAGTTLPLITYYLIKQGFGESSIGYVYTSNTLGSILGILLAVHVIMPFIGLKNLIIIGGIIDIIIGLSLLWYERNSLIKLKWKYVLLASMIIILSCIFFLEFDIGKSVSSVYSTGNTVSKWKEESLFHKDGKTASVDVTNTIFNIIRIYSNGRCEGNYFHQEIDMERYNVLTPAFAMAFNRNAKDIATFGIGSGQSTHILLMNPDIQNLDLIEIEEALVEGVEKFNTRYHDIFTSPNCNIHIEDARTFFASNNKKYDLIISFPSVPWASGVAGLFTKEFYQHVSKYINHDGLFVQWITMHELDLTLYASIINALSLTFNDYALYLTNDRNTVLIASMENVAKEPGDHIFDYVKLKETLKFYGIQNKSDLQLRKLGNKSSLDPLFSALNSFANSDYYPILDQNAVKSRYLNKNAFELRVLRTNTIPIVSILEGEHLLPNESKYSIIPQNSILATRVQIGMGMYQSLRSMIETDYQPLVALDSNSAILINNILEIQSNSDLHEQNWILNLHELMSFTLPYLSKYEMSIIWRSILNNVSLNSFHSDIQNWISFYVAVGNRDFDNIIYYSDKLLNGERPENELHTILTAKMLAIIVNQNYVAVLNLYKQYYADIKSFISVKLLNEYAKSMMTNSVKESEDHNINY